MASTPLFLRSAKLTIDTVKIEGLAISFNVKRTASVSANKATITVRNLNRAHRSQLEQLKKAAVRLEAGYQDATSLIFSGDLRTTTSTRDGSDIVTTCTSGDGENAIRSSRVNISVAKGSPVDKVFSQLAKAIGCDVGNLQQLLAGSITLRSGSSVFAEGTVISGNAARELTNLCRSTGFQWSIQNGKLQILAVGTALRGEAIKLSTDTGLVGSPTVDTKGVAKATMLMAPDVFPGRAVVLDSERLKGQYRIESTEHKGDTHGQDWYIDMVLKRY